MLSKIELVIFARKFRNEDFKKPTDYIPMVVYFIMLSVK